MAFRLPESEPCYTSSTRFYVIGSHALRGHIVENFKNSVGCSDKDVIYNDKDVIYNDNYVIYSDRDVFPRIDQSVG